MVIQDIDETTLPPPDPLTDDLLPLLPRSCHPPGSLVMLRLIAYDISDRKRWHRICETCEDFGVRVQLSLFECWLDDATFQAFWVGLEELIDPAEDRLAAYTLDAGAAGKRRTAGQGMICTQPCRYYVV